MPLSPKLIAPNESGVKDSEDRLEVEKTERHYAHALNCLSAKSGGPNLEGQVVGVSSSVPVDKLANGGDTDPSDSVSVTEEMPF